MVWDGGLGKRDDETHFPFLTAVTHIFLIGVSGCIMAFCQCFLHKDVNRNVVFLRY